MVYRGSDEALGLPVEQIAQLLIKAGQQDSTLLSRGQTVLTAAPGNQVSEEIPAARHREQLPSAFGAPSAAEPEPYMEQLVSIAVASARRAEDASLLATETGRIAKRAAVLITMFGSLGGLAGIAAIVDHRLSDRLDTGSAAMASEVHATTKANPRADNPPSEEHPQAPERATITSAGLASSGTDRAPNAVAGGAPESMPGDTVTAGLPAGSIDGGFDTTTRTANQVQQPLNIPVRSVVGVPYPTQPYGFNSAETVRSASPITYAQSWPKRYYPVARRVTVPHNSAPSGNPVRDFQRFVTALGEGLRSVFR